MGKRIGIIGGSFDPIHIGHLIIAQDACEQFELDRILFLPAYKAPLKGQKSIASPEQRMAMTRLAVTDDERFEVSNIDFEREDASYSIRSAQRLSELHPKDELVWILGADQIAQLDQWREIEKLVHLVRFVAFERTGSDPKGYDLPKGARVSFAKSRILEISSTEIRDRIKSNASAKYFLPAPVLDYIKANNLYAPQPKMELAANEKASK